MPVSGIQIRYEPGVGAELIGQDIQLDVRDVYWISDGGPKGPDLSHEEAQEVSWFTGYQDVEQQENDLRRRRRVVYDNTEHRQPWGCGLPLFLLAIIVGAAGLIAVLA
jgi:hypothetical protein